MPSTVARSLSILALTSPLACGDPVASAADESSTSSGSSGSPPTSGDQPSTESGVDDSGTSSSSTGDESSSSTTEGETGEPADAGIELVISAVTPGGWLQFFYYAVDDSGTVGPVQITEPGEFQWDVVEFVPGRRAVYRGAHAGGDDVVLGAVDSDDELVALDVPPVGDGRVGFPTRVPGAEAVVFGEQQTGTIFRVDFPGGVPMPPVAVMDGVWSAESQAPLLDPTGRWVADHLLGGAPGAIDLAVARVDVPDLDGVVRLTAATGEEYGGNEVFTGDGNSLFYVYSQGAAGGNELRHVDLRGDSPGDTSVVEAFADEAPQYLFPTTAGAGLVYSVAAAGVSQSSLWSTHASDDGSVAPPTLFLDEVGGTYWYMWTSPDGRWMAFHVEVGGTERAFVLDVGDVAAPQLHELDIDAPGVAVFSQDSQWLFFEHDTPDGGSISRYPLGDEPGARELVAANDGVILIGEPRGITSGATTLLASGYADDAPAQLVFDLTGPLPATPTILNAPLPAGYWAQFGELLRDDRRVAYIERADVFGPQRMMLADLAHPGEAVQVMPSIQYWVEVPASR